MVKGPLFCLIMSLKHKSNDANNLDMPEKLEKLQSKEVGVY